jgi:hypothetical protein
MKFKRFCGGHTREIKPDDSDSGRVRHFLFFALARIRSNGFWYERQILRSSTAQFDSTIPSNLALFLGYAG